MKERKEIFYEIGAKNIDQGEWLELGEPVTWYKVYQQDYITIWDDRAFGSIRLRVGEKISEHYDFVAVDNIAVFGSAYEGTLKTFVPYIVKE